jgi:general secretion pathway protein L
MINKGISSTSLRPFGLGAIALFASFGRWWLGELQTLCSGRMAGWLLGPARKSVELELVENGTSLFLVERDRGILDSRYVTSTEYFADTLDGFVKANRLMRKDVDIALRLPSDRFFSRQLLLPVQAIRDFPAIVLNEISKRTPFRTERIYHHFSVQPSGQPGSCLVCIWIIKRDYVDDALSRLKLTVDDVALVRGEGQPDQFPVPEIPLRSDRRPRAWYWSSVRLLLATVVVLGVVAVGLKFWQQQSLLEQLDIKIAASRAKAQQVRAQLDDIGKLQAAIRRVRVDKSTIPCLLEVWDQVTITLPTHSWLSELQLTQSSADIPEQRLSLTGYSEAAASLVRVFDRSSLFRDASLTSPITVDPTEGKERFGLRMKVRSLTNPGSVAR